MACFIVVRGYDYVKEGEPRKADKDVTWEVVGEKHPTLKNVTLPFTFESEKMASVVARALSRDAGTSYRYKVVAAIHTDADLTETGGA